MKRAVWLILLLNLALAEGFPEFFKRYLEQNPDWARATAQETLAERRYRALLEDPWAAPLEREEAAEAKTKAAVEKGRLRLELWQAALLRYSAPLLAEAKKDAAEAALAVARIKAEAAAIRYRHGAINKVELVAAEKETEEARLALEAAEAELKAARAFLAEYGVPPPTALPEISPPKDPRPEHHPRYRLAELALAAARRAYALAQGPDTARIVRTQKEAELFAAQKALQAAREDLEKALLEAQRARRQAKAALALQTEALKTAEERLAAAQARYQKGLVSRLELEAARAERSRAELALLNARLELLKATAALYAFAEEGP